MTKQVRFCGFGGQGVILAGLILGQAGIVDGKWVASSGTYGPSARGGACRSDVVISDRAIVFPQVIKIDVLISLSQQGYDRFIGEVKDSSSVVIYDGAIVPKEIKDLSQVPIPATRAAIEELGNEIVAIMIILGSMVEMTGVVGKEALLEATKERVPERFRDLNLRAIEIGFKVGAGKLRETGF
jgi:2-oxoglutarate ferredoxin oxidoreductase subunit gamma